MKCSHARSRSEAQTHDCQWSYPKRTSIFLLCLLLTICGLAAGDRWPQFRGPEGSGISQDQAGPSRWSATENVAWVVEIAGRGWSSPIVWRDRIFVTSAINPGDFKEPWTGIYGNDYIKELLDQGIPQEEVMRRVRQRDNEVTDELKGDIRWMVYALDAATGRLLWEREAYRGAPYGGRHRKNTYSSETPVTDGERVYAYFGNVGLFAYTLDGDPVWEKKWDPQPIYLDFGTASSPVVVDGKVIVLNDNQQDSFITALDAATGRELWKTPRKNEHPMIRSGFSTPFVWRNRVRTEIVAMGASTVTSYDLEGRELWRFRGTSAVAAPTPVASTDLLYLGSGSPSETVRPLLAVRAGAEGDISLQDGHSSNDHVAWYHRRGGSYITSPILYKNRLYVLYDKGFLASYNASTGEEIYRARIEKGGNTFSSSPWIYDEKIFCLSEDGKTFVIDPGDEFKILWSNDLAEVSLATPAIAHGSLFLRTKTRLFRIDQPKSEGS